MTQASSSSSFVGAWKYDVFLSFRGEDTRTSFTDHLYHALLQAGIYTFMDDQLQRGEEISTALLKAIEESRISIVVFSQKYASSKWCLEELVKILQCKQSKQQLVRPIFYKVDPSHIRNQRGSFGDAFVALQCKHKDNMDKVHKWREALTEAANLSGWPLLDGHESESSFIQKIVGEISEQLGNYAHLDVAKYPVGMESRVQHVNALLDLEEDNIVRMVGIWGTGGIGKTTIAKAVYNSIAHKFKGSCFLANVRECSESHAGGLMKLQNTLLSKILKGTKLKVANCDEGATLIKERLRHKKVLLVLDDVNHVKQLDSLAGGSDWFGGGSRIIITTRDKKVLTVHDVNLIYKVEGLNYHEALELFSWYAFKGNAPSADYAELADHGIRCAGGLPLVLILLGSHLRGESLEIWKPTLDGLIQGRELQVTFIISYNQLDPSVKEVFLDIACFFKGRNKNYVTEILEACSLNPKYGIEVLIQKALISIEGTLIWMHDLLEEMGKQIVHQESPTEAGERSRVWFHEDVRHVLEANTGTKSIKGIIVKLAEDDDHICLNKKSFRKMKNLKIFINHNACITGDVRNLPNKLRVLDWYKLQSFPTDSLPKELVVLKLPFNRIKQPAKCFKPYFTKMTILNLSDSEYLTQIQDLSGCPNLKELCAVRCGNLVEVDPSVGFLEKLEVLDFSDCTNLRKFPKELRLKSLKRFSLDQCRRFKKFPEIMDVVESISLLDLGGTSIQNLPSSIMQLIGLYELRLDGTAIKELPLSIGNLVGLEELDLNGCKDLTNVPQSIFRLQRLRRFNLDRCSKLESIDFKECNNLNNSEFSSLGLLPKLMSIDFKECNLSNVDSLASFGCSSELWMVNLSRGNFVRLPVCISKFVNLQRLVLLGCERLQEISEPLPPNIERINVGDCISLERFSTLSKILEDGKMQRIERMNLSKCQRLCDSVGMDVSKMATILLDQQLRENRCIEVVLPGIEVPEWFSCRKDVHDECDHEMREVVFEIPRGLKWENMMSLVVCVVFTITDPELNSLSNYGDRAGLAYITIDGEHTVDVDISGFFNSTETASSSLVVTERVNIALPLDMKTKAEVDDSHSSNQLMPFKSLVFTYYHPRGVTIKSCGVHLQTQAPKQRPKEEDDYESAQDLEDEYQSNQGRPL